ncbi:MAG: hypothetical protein KF812_01450 [Fimbriimonadaceae bacterium]|nr:hypothetical protein [Fimbriimonadaceae bacterium]
MRHKPRPTIGVAMTGLLALLIIACGGSGGVATPEEGFRGFTETPVDVAVSLPAGGAVPPMTELVAWTSLGEEKPDGAGNANLEVYNDGPQFASVLDANGEMVLGGFVGGDRKSLDTTSTAEMFTYFALGGPLHPGPDSQEIFLNGIKELVGFANVIAAVEASIAANGYVTASDPGVKAAIDEVRNSALAGKGRNAETRGPEVSPEGGASGLDINDSVDDQIQITNTALRRSYAWLERTGYKDDNGATHEMKEAIRDLWIDVPTRYGGKVDRMTGLIQGQYPWTPIASSPIPVLSDLASVENETEVYYKLTTVGVGRYEGDFDDLTPEQFNKWKEIVYWTAYLDFYMPIYANLVLPMDGTAFDSLAEFALTNSNAQQFIAGAQNSMPELLDLTARGQFPDGLRSFVTSPQTATVTTPVSMLVVTEWGRSTGKELFSGDKELINRVGIGARSIGMQDLASVIQLMAPFDSFASADQANVFEITSSRAAVKLVPEATEIGISDVTDIKAVIKNKSTSATYRYEWSVTGEFFLNDGHGGSTDESPGGILKSVDDEVFIGNLTKNAGTPTVTCSVYIGNQLVGKANTRITFRENIKNLNAKFRVEGTVVDNDGNGYWNYRTWVIAEVSKFEDAAHYALTIDDADGKNILRRNWSRDYKFAVRDEEVWMKQPEGTFWIVYDGISSAYGFSSREQALEDMADRIASLERKHQGDVLEAKAFLE